LFSSRRIGNVTVEPIKMLFATSGGSGVELSFDAARSGLIGHGGELECLELRLAFEAGVLERKGSMTIQGNYDLKNEMRDVIRYMSSEFRL
jgi:hypothetical protein